MTTITAPSVYREYHTIPPINKHTNDYTNPGGVRVCVPIYIDPPTNLRKELLNGVRAVANQSLIAETVHPETGLVVQQSSSRQSEVEHYIGMSIEALRSVLFQRGGIEASLLLKLQAVAGIEIVSEKEIYAGFKAKQAVVKDFIASYPFPYTPATQG